MPSPCGPNSECREIGDVPSCTCKSGYVGSPPNCRPECTINSECQSNLACIRQKCQDPCPGSCGIGAVCNVINHTPICSCPDGYIGDPFNNCYPKPISTSKYYFRPRTSATFNIDYLQHQHQLLQILVIHRLADQMQIVIMEYALVCQNIKEILIAVVDRNVF